MALDSDDTVPERLNGGSANHRITRLETEIFGPPGRSGGLKVGAQSLRDDVRTLVSAIMVMRSWQAVLIVASVSQLLLLVYGTYLLRSVCAALRASGMLPG